MDQAKADILIHLARQSIYCISRGDLIVALHDVLKPERLPMYQSLNKSGYIRQRKVLGSKVYQLSKRGWNKLTEGQKREIIDEYEDWVERIRPSIAGPEWLEWIK